jgi:predicted aspartyl protease
MQPVVRLPTLTVGSAQKSGMLATVLRSSQLRSLAGKADGILGMDFLAGRRYMLDFHRKLLRWEPSRETGVPNAIHVQVRRSQGRSLVAVAGGGHVFWFVADSGADTLILFRSEDRPALPTLKLDGRVVLDTAGGRSMADRVLVSELRLGALTLRNVPAIQLPVERDRPAEVDGLLPLHLFARVLFDPESESMMVVPR